MPDIFRSDIGSSLRKDALHNESLPKENLPASGHGVRAAIASAAEATGVDFTYLLTKARLESSLNPDAKAPTSSASGLFQFIGSTWLETLNRHGADHGLGWAAQHIRMSKGQASVADPAMRATIMNLRHDPQISALMAGEFARDNASGLAPVLGREPDGPELYLAHFLGLDGASRFLRALSADPGQSAVQLFPRAAGANAAIFRQADGSARSLDQVMRVIRHKYHKAQGQEHGAAGTQLAHAYQPAGKATTFAPVPASATTPAFAAPWQAAGAPAAMLPARPSMADVLRTTFLDAGHAGAGSGAGHGARGHDQVRVAYERLRGLGL